MSVELRLTTLSKFEPFQREWGLRSRTVTVERILEELFAEDPEE